MSGIIGQMSSIAFDRNSGSNIGGSSGIPRRTRVKIAWASFERRLRTIMERAPHETPLDSNTRGQAHRQQSFIERQANLDLVTLAVNLQKDRLHAEPLVLHKDYRFSFMADATVPFIAEFLDHRGSCLQSVEMPSGYDMKFDFDLRFKRYPSGTRTYKVLLRPALPSTSSTTTFDSPIQTNILQVNPTKEGAIEVRVTKQTVRIGKKEIEMLEIYGQQTESRQPCSAKVEMRDVGGASCVSINMYEEDCASDCVICLTSARDTLFLPCRHMCICLGCAETLGTGDGKCPLCRQVYQSIMTIKYTSAASHSSSQ